MKMKTYFLTLLFAFSLLSANDAIVTIDDQEALAISVETENLLISSLTKEVIPHMQLLRMKRENLVHFANSDPIAPEKTAARCRNWIKRWKSGSPFSAMSVFTKSGEFVGYAILGFGDDPDTGEEDVPGLSEFALILDCEQWGKGYGTEIMDALFFSLAPRLKEEGFDLNGAPLQSILYTTSPKNIGMVRIAEKLELEPRCILPPNVPGNPWNTERYFYRIDL